MGPKEIENYYDRLRKKGHATFKVIFKAGPEDDSFLSDDPLAHVVVTATDHITGKVIKRTSQMSAKADEFEVEIPVLDVVGVLRGFLDRVRGKERPKPYQVTISVQPHSDWKQNYESKEFPMEVQVGPNPPQHVWMVRTKKSPFKLDKNKVP